MNSKVSHNLHEMGNLPFALASLDFRVDSNSLCFFDLVVVPVLYFGVEEAEGTCLSDFRLLVGVVLFDFLRDNVRFTSFARVSSEDEVEGDFSPTAGKTSRESTPTGKVLCCFCKVGGVCF